MQFLVAMETVLHTVVALKTFNAKFYVARSNFNLSRPFWRLNGARPIITFALSTVDVKLIWYWNNNQTLIEEKLRLINMTGNKQLHLHFSRKWRKIKISFLKRGYCRIQLFFTDLNLKSGYKIFHIINWSQIPWGTTIRLSTVNTNIVY